MNRLLGLQAFCSVVEQSGFRRAADALGMPSATVSKVVQQLEAELGVKLLERTTRRVAATVDGRAYYERMHRLLAEIEETDALVTQSVASPSGRLRVSAPASLTRLVLAPALTTLLERYPKLTIEWLGTDRAIDLVAEGVDCVVRVGDVHDELLVARPLRNLPQYLAAAPALIGGRPPRTLRQLEQLPMVNFVSARTGQSVPAEVVDPSSTKVHPLRCSWRVSVSDGETYVAVGVAGAGLVQAPMYDLKPHLASGALVLLMPRWKSVPARLNLMYPRNRHLSARVRVFADWVTGVIGAMA